jgi:D-alanine transaminase
MPRHAYVNGRFVPHDSAVVHIEDRGFQFADGIYEVVAIVEGRLLDEEGHLQRLSRSLGEIRLNWPVKPPTLKLLMRELVQRNRVRNGLLYLQISRGVAKRDFGFPVEAAPTLVMTCRSGRFQTRSQVEQGVAVVTLPDIRWSRRDIKSVALLPQVLGKQQARESGAFEGWLVDPDGMVTEGCSSNAWIVLAGGRAGGRVVTRPPSNRLLNGITRLSLLDICRSLPGLSVEERPFTVAEARQAEEAFLSSAGTFVIPIVRIDGEPVGNGRPGPVAVQLRRAYLAAHGVSDPVLS